MSNVKLLWHSPALRRFLVFMLMFALLVKYAPTSFVAARDSESPSKATALLCGRMVSLLNQRTEEKGIGLLPCGSNSPYVLQEYPQVGGGVIELHNVTIVEGQIWYDAEFGPINRYITNFRSAKAIKNCKACGKEDATFTPTLLPTFTRTPTTTSTPTPTDTLTPSPTPVDSPTPSPSPTQQVYIESKCVDYLGITVAGGLGISDFQSLINEANQAMEAAKASAACTDEACWQKALAEALFKGMARASVRFSTISFPPDKLMPVIANLITDPQRAQACGKLEISAWEMAKQFSLFGSPIDAFAVHSPAKLLLKDKNGKRTGFLPDGTKLEEIPNSRAVVGESTEYVFAPGGSWETAELKGTADGNVTLEVIENSSAAVAEYSFANIPVTGQTNASLVAGQSSPLFVVDMRGDGQASSYPPSDFESTPREAGWLPTATPVVADLTQTPTATSPLEAIPIPGLSTDFTGWLFLGGMVVAVLGVLTGGFLILGLAGRKRRKI